MHTHKSDGGHHQSPLYFSYTHIMGVSVPRKAVYISTEPRSTLTERARPTFFFDVVCVDDAVLFTSSAGGTCCIIPRICCCPPTACCCRCCARMRAIVAWSSSFARDAITHTEKTSSSIDLRDRDLTAHSCTNKEGKKGDDRLDRTRASAYDVSRCGAHPFECRIRPSIESHERRAQLREVRQHESDGFVVASFRGNNDPFVELLDKLLRR